MMRPTRANKPMVPSRSYRIATAPEPNSGRLTSFKSTRFDRPRTTSARGPLPGLHYELVLIDQSQLRQGQRSFTPPTNSPLPGSRLSC